MSELGLLNKLYQSKEDRCYYIEGYYIEENKIKFCKWFAQRPQMDIENKKIYYEPPNFGDIYPRLIIKNINDLSFFENNKFFKGIINKKPELQKRWESIKVQIEKINKTQNKESYEKITVTLDNFYKQIKIYKC